MRSEITKKILSETPDHITESVKQYGDKIMEEFKKETPEVNQIIFGGYTYRYVYKLAKDKIDLCLATKDPTKYCNGLFLYSSKDPGNGLEFVVIKTNNPIYFDYGIYENFSDEEIYD